jgi:hypothetical protein
LTLARREPAVGRGCHAARGSGARSWDRSQGTRDFDTVERSRIVKTTRAWNPSLRSSGSVAASSATTARAAAYLCSASSRLPWVWRSLPRARSMRHSSGRAACSRATLAAACSMARASTHGRVDAGSAAAR